MGGRPCAHSPESLTRVTASRCSLCSWHGSLRNHSGTDSLPRMQRLLTSWNHSLASGKNQEPSGSGSFSPQALGLTQVQSLANHRVSESELLFLIQMFPFLF